MKSYPSIVHSCKGCPAKIWAFDKLDGSNIRVEWNFKRGFYKFGTRTQLLSPEDRVFGGIPDLFQATLADSLHEVFMQQRWKTALAFLEYWGPGSFAGTHDLKTLKHLALIDISHDHRGILEPEHFLRVSEGLPRASLVYSGPLTDEFVEDVKSSTLEGITHEGVVCKGPHVSPGLPWMAKIKTMAWYDALRVHCRGNMAMFEKLK